jgi:hypothetical protein
MLRELFALWRDRGSRAARRFGHDREAVSIAARHRRCHAAWAPHLEAVKAFILESAATAAGTGTAVILGSGLCLDVPLAELCTRFREVFLVDVHHPRQARALAKRYRNIRLIETDVTGMVQSADFAAKSATPLPHPVPVPDPLPGLTADFTASVNLASQLAIPFRKILDGKTPEAELAAFCRGLIEAHVRWLESLPGQTCLVCDRTWQCVDGEEILESLDALEGVVLPPPDRSWIWRIAPRPEESHAYDRQNQVWGYCDIKAARAAFVAADATPEREP